MLLLLPWFVIPLLLQLFRRAWLATQLLGCTAYRAVGKLAGLAYMVEDM